MHRTDNDILTDKHIIDGFLRGDQKHCQIILGWIDEIIKRILWTSINQASDIRSDTTYKLLVNFRENRFKNKSSLKAYVQQITRFTLIDIIRRQRRQPVHIDDDPPAPDTPYTIVISKEEKAIFSRILDLIDERCRDLWIMIFEKQMPYKEIARQEKVKEATIKSRVYRCKEEVMKIRKQIS